jgi:phage baseplate assembly protein W
MAIELKIHPLDFEPDIAIGIDLPMMTSQGAGFQQTYTTLNQAVANAKNLLFTNKGERIMQPDFGCDLRSLLFENITEILLANIEDTIRSSFDYWLPYIFINELSITSAADQNRVFITMKISLEGNKFDTRSIQLEVINTAI